MSFILFTVADTVQWEMIYACKGRSYVSKREKKGQTHAAIVQYSTLQYLT